MFCKLWTSLGEILGRPFCDDGEGVWSQSSPPESDRVQVVGECVLRRSWGFPPKNNADMTTFVSMTIFKVRISPFGFPV